MFYYGNRLAHGEVADVRDFLEALRRYFLAGWTWGAANLLVIALLIGDYIVTGRLSASPAARFTQGFYLAALGIWLLIQLFALPFLFEQEKASLWQGIRNGAVFVGRAPVFSLFLGVLLILTLALGAALFMLSGAAGGVFLAVAGNRAVISRLEGNRAVSQRDRFHQKRIS
jgi:hypothetical protein